MIASKWCPCVSDNERACIQLPGMCLSGTSFGKETLGNLNLLQHEHAKDFLCIDGVLVFEFPLLLHQRKHKQLVHLQLEENGHVKDATTFELLLQSKHWAWSKPLPDDLWQQLSTSCRHHSPLIAMFAGKETVSHTIGLLVAPEVWGRTRDTHNQPFQRRNGWKWIGLVLMRWICTPSFPIPLFPSKASSRPAPIFLKTEQRDQTAEIDETNPAFYMHSFAWHCKKSLLPRSPIWPSLGLETLLEEFLDPANNLLYNHRTMNKTTAEWTEILNDPTFQNMMAHNFIACKATEIGSPFLAESAIQKFELNPLFTACEHLYENVTNITHINWQQLTQITEGACLAAMRPSVAQLREFRALLQLDSPVEESVWDAIDEQLKMIPEDICEEPINPDGDFARHVLYSGFGSPVRQNYYRQNPLVKFLKQYYSFMTATDILNVTILTSRNANEMSTLLREVFDRQVLVNHERKKYSGDTQALAVIPHFLLFSAVRSIPEQQLVRKESLHFLEAVPEEWVGWLEGKNSIFVAEEGVHPLELTMRGMSRRSLGELQKVFEKTHSPEAVNFLRLVSLTPFPDVLELFFRQEKQ